ncbi:MAG: SDR family oxidoreductase [Parcubacteria group bacterium]|nr:MAG: SDR family oxidoreductase [Parcubacteria group bacterium]
MNIKKTNELLDFHGQTVLVTGASMGIGYGIARRFAEAGADIVLADISPLGEQKAQELAQTFGVKTLFVKTDVSSENDVISLFEQVAKEFGKLDALINNAGIFPMKPVLEMDLALWEKIQAINLRGTFLCCREAGKLMVKTKKGNIINIASVDALHPSSVGLAAYDASKHGVWGLTKNLALELAPHKIRVNAIAPGGIRTEGVETMSAGATKAAANPEAPAEAPMDVPWGRMGEPDEMATTALFLASDMASYVTGSIIVADGGMLLK